MNFLSLLSLFIVFLSTNTQEDTSIAYDVIKGDKVLGQMIAEQTTQDGISTYKSSSSVNYKVVFDVLIEYECAVTMKNNELFSAEAQIIANGNVREHTITKKSGNGYRIAKNGKAEDAFLEKIEYPAVLLLFEEPVNVSNSFSEKNGAFHSIEAMGNHSYKVTTSSGKTNRYYYENGELQRAELDSGIFKFEIIRS